MDQRELSSAFAATARTLSRSMSPEETLSLIVETARISVPDMNHVGISTIDRHGNVSTQAATDDLVWQLDKLQYELKEGPCVDSLHHAVVVEAPDIRHDQRWPRYVPAAVELGLRSQLAVKLYLDEEGTLGGLNLYSTVSYDIDPESSAIADLFATYAALALGKSREVHHLHQALRTRELIGKAVGITMMTYDLTDHAAFAFLVRTSANTNTKLRILAERVVEAHNSHAGRSGRNGS